MSVIEEMSAFSNRIYTDKYAFKYEDGSIETWPETARRVATNVLSVLPVSYEDQMKVYELIRQRKFIPGGRYLYASGRLLHQINNCLLMKAEDSREGWAELLYKSTMALQTGAGIGVDYSDIRPSGSLIKKTGGVASGPLATMKMVNEVARNVMQGGNRRSALWAGLNWRHSDVLKFIVAKNWPEVVIREKEKDFSFPGDLDMTNISVLLDDDFFIAFHEPFHEWHSHAVEVYDLAVRQMLRTGEPGFSIDIGENAGETLRNACTEITSFDDSDVCNLGSINLARIENIQELDEVVKYSTLFLLAGSEYSHLPYNKVYDVREKNRRLGLGLMGIHEWLLQRGKSYGPDEELGRWLNIYTRSTKYAHDFADSFRLSRPVKTRAIAPNGTISIVGETTGGCEPIIYAAYKRRVREASPDGDVVRSEFVIDPTAKRLIEQGVDPSSIEDSYVLSYQVERRIAFQAWLQKYVDHGISSTINLPYPITNEAEVQDFKDTLIKYLPELRGITVYPSGARAGQPIVSVPLEYALQHEGEVFIETEEDTCRGGICGA